MYRQVLSGDPGPIDPCTADWMTCFDCLGIQLNMVPDIDFSRFLVSFIGIFSEFEVGHLCVQSSLPAELVQAELLRGFWAAALPFPSRRAPSCGFRRFGEASIQL